MVDLSFCATCLPALVAECQTCWQAATSKTRPSRRKKNRRARAPADIPTGSSPCACSSFGVDTYQSPTQILETEGGSLSWAAVQAPVGDIPAARHRHSACEVPAAAGFAGGVITRGGGGGGVLVFGGEGRASEGPGVRSTDSHEVLLYDPKVWRWPLLFVA